MSLPKSPFAASTASPGAGDIQVSLLPPDRQVLTTCTYQYPLKLIFPDPHHVEEKKHVTVVFLLTYGGGLVGGDKINLRVELDALTRLVLVTQGSTKLFKSPSRSILSGQTLDVKIGQGAALCYLPDPTQPFAESAYEQKQTFYVEPDGSSSLLMLDWVSEGRRARGESWTLWEWRGRNEVRTFDPASRGRLLLRDAVTLTDATLAGIGLTEKTNEMGIFGTLIIYGSVFSGLGRFFMEHFGSQQRIGAKNFSDHTTDADAEGGKNLLKEGYAQLQNIAGLLWTAANVRGFVLVKFAARDPDSARLWLGTLLRLEGTVQRHFGHQALIGLR
jgi:urease accessory protein